MTTLFLIGQIVLGVYFILSGAMHFMKLKDMTAYANAKHLPMPSAAVMLSGAVMLLGGVGVLFQMQLVWAYAGLIGFLVLAAFLMHNFWADQDPQAKMGNRINFQKNLAIAAALCMLLASQLG